MLYSKTNVAEYSRFLVKLAWGVEIIAVTIGLTISIVVAISAFSSANTDTEVSLMSGLPAMLVAGLPFVMIAVVELCKIPLTFTFLTVKSVAWRLLILVFVLFLCSITFETMLNGFERNFSNLNRSIDERKNKIESVNSEIGLLEKRRSNIVKFTEEDVLLEVETNRTSAQTQYSNNARRIDRTTQNTLANIDYSFQDEIDAEIVGMMNTRDKYYSEWAAETSAVEDRFSSLLLGNISGSSEERSRLLAELDALKAEFAQALDKANFVTRAGVDAKYRDLIATKESQVAQITSSYLGADAIEKQSSMEAQLKQQLEFVNGKYAGRVDDMNARIEAAKTEIETRTASNARLESAVVSKASSDKSRFARIRKEQNTEIDNYLEAKTIELEVMAEKSFGIDESIYALRDSQRVLQSEINHLINENQVYRMAMYVYGIESATDVDRNMVGTIALLWFGSLSLIASVCGVILALTSFYLSRVLEMVLEQEAAEKAAAESDHAHKSEDVAEPLRKNDVQKPASNAKDDFDDAGFGELIPT